MSPSGKEPCYGDRFVELRKEKFPDDRYPGSALITVTNFARSGMEIEIQGIAGHRRPRLMGPLSSRVATRREAEQVLVEGGVRKPARTGAAYIAGRRKRPPELHLHGDA